MKYSLYTLLIASLLTFYSQQLSAQAISTQSGMSIQTIVGDSLITGCLEALNITANNGAFGYFNNNDGPFPFSSGLIIASGPIDNAEGPNNSGSQGGSLGSGGDSDLAAIASGFTINDATVVEFDFIPASNEVSFKYIFGSEEFPEYANSSFNDAFGFFLSGPGISGPYSNSAINIAILPNGQPVTIDNVHNYNYYIASPSSSSNSPGSYSGSVEYDGNTIVLTATATVQACETYHIKLAVGDAGDSAYDSGVFIEAGSFVSGSSIEGFNNSQFGGASDLWEGCENYYVLSRVEGADTSDPITINVNYGGGSTATQGVDVTEFPDEVTIPAGEMTETIYYSAYNDEMDEGNETIVLEFSTSCPCGNQSSIIRDTIWIYDAQRIKGGVQDVQTDYCGESPPDQITLYASCNLDTSQVSTVYYYWSTGETGHEITVPAEPGATTYYVTMADDCGNEIYDSVTIRVSSMQNTTNASSPVSCHDGCDGSFTMEMINDYQPFEYTYVHSWYIYFPDSIHTQGINTFNNLCPGTYLVTVTDDIGCRITHEFTLDNPPPINYSLGITEADMEFCEDPGNITLHAEANQDASFSWFNGSSGNSVSFPVAQGSNDYWVEISDACDNIFLDEITISLSNLSASASSNPDDGSCNGEAWANASGGIEPYNFYWPGINEFGNSQEELCAGQYVVNISDAIGCSETLEVDVDFEVGISSINNKWLEIYPNPSDGNFVITLKNSDYNNASIEITDMSGKVIMDNIITKDNNIDVEILNSGVYIITLKNDNKTISSNKIVVIK